MKHNSIIELRGDVSFPELGRDRHYMIPFMQAEGLPDIAKRWQSTVDQMLDGIKTDQPVYLMVDEGFVPAGQTHRRPGVHIDGYWGVHAHGPARHAPEPTHGPGRRHRSGGGHITWSNAPYTDPEAIILATNVSAARGYVGEFEGFIGDGGDCSSINVDDLIVVPFPSHRVVAGNVTALHESLPLPFANVRQLVRLNVPGWSPERMDK